VGLETRQAGQLVTDYLKGFAVGLAFWLALYVLVMGCSHGGRGVPHRYAGPGPLDLGALKFCVPAELASGDRVAFCTPRRKVCERIAGLARSHGDSWWVPGDVRLAWLDHCGANGLRPPPAPTPATAPQMHVSSQRAVWR
jgi:hypothetical protein